MRDNMIYAIDGIPLIWALLTNAMHKTGDLYGKQGIGYVSSHRALELAVAPSYMNYTV